MTKNLVIVESPAKSATIKKYLGKDFTILASYGHVRDLIPKEGAVDVSHDFAMRYELIEKNTKHVTALVQAAKKAEAIYLATDPDREGEAISWHVAEILKERNVLKDKALHRVVFYEITKSAVQEAVANPRSISIDMVNAQQARRALDYLVGFKLSPLLWRKVRRGLSAGRVQSPALRLIVERELEIEAFKPQEYWTILSDNRVHANEFQAKLILYRGEKVEQFTVNNATSAQEIEADLSAQAQGKLLVTKVEKKQRKRHPAPPFTTSTLQQEASRKLGFSARKTMQVAQQLYEGVDVGEGSVGLISYMRTDSVNLAEEALQEIRALIATRYGAEDVPEEARYFKTKSRNAQEAHEAIRPTSVLRIPEDIKSFLTPDQFKLYQLVWQRAMACQMIHATLNTVAIDLQCGEAGNVFRATGSTIANPGFIKVYQEGFDDTSAEDDDEKLLPALEEGQEVELLRIHGDQHFTEPPPRYSEASLVKALEEYGIGRPSTYASIISTLQQREYVTLEAKRFHPTDVGRVVARFLTEYFTKYVDYDFTATMEDGLDDVSEGKKEWIPMLREFWDPFSALIKKVDESVQRSDVTQEKIDEACPKCAKPLSIRLGRSGRFIGCTAYPECDYTRNMDDSAETSPTLVEGRVCPECQSPLILRAGPYGKFIGCSSYPKCRFIEPLEKPKDTQVVCPKCNKGNICQRKSKRGKIFYSCARYPDCDYALWNEPIASPCPKCAWPLLTIKVTKTRGKTKLCPKEGCGFSEAMDESE